MSPLATRPGPVFPECQRWSRGRESYRPAGELFDPGRASVAEIPEAEAKAYVIREHYSGSYPAARVRVGIAWKEHRFAREVLSGVAVFAVGMNPRTIPSRLGCEASAGVELSRFVLAPTLMANAETWFLGRCFRILRASHPNIRAVLSYADPMPRLRSDGTVLKPGHIGTIYQGHNARYLGLSSPRRLLVAGDGTVLSPRSLSKIRNRERGHEYSLRRLYALGIRAHAENLDDALAEAVRDRRLTVLQHRGNHCYGWLLDARRGNPFLERPRLPYPKGFS